MEGQRNGVVTLLLPEVHSTVDPSPKQASLSSAVFNISTSMIGAGIMSIPATFKVLGVILALIVILGGRLRGVSPQIYTFRKVYYVCWFDG